MFLIFGVTEKQRDIEFSQFHTCSICGSYSNFEVYQTYTAFSLFFIPVIKWNRKYYVKARCCGSLYTIDESLGRDIENGIKREIQPSELQLIQGNYRREKRCGSCGYLVDPDYDYCPKCGNPM